MEDFGELLKRLRSSSPGKSARFLSFCPNRPLDSEELDALADALRGTSSVTGLRLQGECSVCTTRRRWDCRVSRAPLARIPWLPAGSPI